MGTRWQQALASGQPFETEYRVCRQDGRWRWFSARANPQFDSTGRITRWIGSSSDIDEIRRPIIASERAADRLRLATEAAQPASSNGSRTAHDWDERARNL